MYFALFFQSECLFFIHFILLFLSQFHMMLSFFYIFRAKRLNLRLPSPLPSWFVQIFFIFLCKKDFIRIHLLDPLHHLIRQVQEELDLLFIFPDYHRIVRDVIVI